MDYFIAVFSNRTETLDFANKLKQYNIDCSVIAMPKNLGNICGICVKIYSNYFNLALRVFKNQKYLTFNTFYYAKYNGKGDYIYEKANYYFY